MNMFRKIGVVIGLAAVFLLAFYELSPARRLETSVAAQTTKTENDSLAVREEFRNVVIKHIEMGETVTVENDRIGYLAGAVKLIPRKRSEPRVAEMTKSVGPKPKMLLGAEIEAIAGRLRDSQTREGLITFARTASEEDKYIFLNVGSTIVIEAPPDGTKALPKPTETPEKRCYDSCETLCRIVTTSACKWNCRMVNNEKVCEESCPTIATEVCNVVCKKRCD